MSEAIKSLFISIIAAFLYARFSDYIDYWLVYRKSSFTGYWRNCVFDNNNNIVKVDYCHLAHRKRNGIVKGIILREYPEKQNSRRWYCNGVIVKDRIIMSFWSMDDSQNSDGSGYLFLTGDEKFEGIYLHSTSGNKIETVKVKSEKIRDVKQIKRVKKLFKK